MPRKSILALALLSLSGCAGATSPTTIGVVDMELALQQTAAGQAARRGLVRDHRARQTELDQRAARLQAREASVQRAANGPIAQAHAAGVSCEEVFAVVRERRELERDFEVHQQQLRERERVAIEAIVTRLRNVVERVSIERELVIVFDQEGYASPGGRRVDLTDEIVRRYDSEYPASAP